MEFYSTIWEKHLRKFYILKGPRAWAPAPARKSTLQLNIPVSQALQAQMTRASCGCLIAPQTNLIWLEIRAEALNLIQYSVESHCREWRICSSSMLYCFLYLVCFGSKHFPKIENGWSMLQARGWKGNVHKHFLSCRTAVNPLTEQFDLQHVRTGLSY